MSSSDKELLILAAKAAGIKYKWNDSFNEPQIPGGFWNPLKDNAQALVLAVKLNMDIISFDRTKVTASTGTTDYLAAAEIKNNDPYAATRRAIVRAAAEIGRSHD